MSIKGQSFTGARSGGAYIDFDPGHAGLAALFAQGWTIAVLAKYASNDWGFFGGYSDTSATTAVGQVFVSNNSGGRLFSKDDFSNGYPDSSVDADGLNDNTWRWQVFNKPTGSAHYRIHYADLSTLTWSHGESVGAANHSDNATPAVLFSTWAIYALGFDSGDVAAIVAWPSSLSDTEIETYCTHLGKDLLKHKSPKAGWLMKAADVGSAGSIVDFMGGGADESARSNVATSADPTDFDMTLGQTVFRTGWTPSNTDPAGSATGGWQFHTNGDMTVTRVGFYKSAGSPPTTVRAKVWAGSATVLGDSGDYDISGFAAGSWVDIPLPVPAQLAADADYIVSVDVAGAFDWMYDPDDTTTEMTSADLFFTIPAGGGRFHPTGTGFPSNTWNGMHGVRLTYIPGTLTPLTRVARDDFNPGSIDSSGNATNGWAFSNAVDVQVTKIGFFKSTSHPPTSVVVQLWDSASTSSPVYTSGSVDISTSPPGWVDIPITPTTVPAGSSYVVSALVSGAFDLASNDSEATSAHTSSDGVITIPAGGGRFNVGSSAVYPASTWNGMVGVRMTYTVPGESLWTPSDGPGVGDFLDPTDGVPGIATSTSFTVASPGTISAVRFYATTNAHTDASGLYTVNLFEVLADDNTPAFDHLAQSITIPASLVTSGTWNQIELPALVTVQPGHLYRASIHSGTSGRYVATNHYWSSADHTSAGGHLTAHHNGDNPTGLGTQNQGAFTTSTDPAVYPYHVGQQANYWVDVVWQPSGGAAAFDASRMLLFFY